MSDERGPKNPDPIEDVRKGLGLLFRAAQSVIREVPTEKIEEVVSTGLREVGRAVESVASSIEREVFRGQRADPSAPNAAPNRPEEGAAEAHPVPLHPEAPIEASAAAAPSEPAGDPKPPETPNGSGA